MNRNLLFNLITFSITWIMWWLLAFCSSNGYMNYGDPIFMVIFVIGGLGPTLAPFLTFLIKKDKNEFKDYLKRLFRFKVSPFYYLFLIFFNIIIFFLTLSFASAFSPNVSINTILKQFISLYKIIYLLPLMIIFGGIEELGWRGISLPELEKKRHPIIASIILTVFWGLWHLPLFYIEGTAQYGTSLLLFSFDILGKTFILTWFYNKTKSIALCVLYHAFFNALSNIPFSQEIGALSHKELISGTIQIIVGLLLLLTIKKKTIKLKTEP